MRSGQSVADSGAFIYPGRPLMTSSPGTSPHRHPKTVQGSRIQINRAPKTATSGRNVSREIYGGCPESDLRKRAQLLVDGHPPRFPSSALPRGGAKPSTAGFRCGAAGTARNEMLLTPDPPQLVCDPVGNWLVLISDRWNAAGR